MSKQLSTSIRNEFAKLLALGSISSPWAILLVQFSDQTDTWPPMEKYKELFTTVGTHDLNMVTWFDEMSHGKVDISDSAVFGPYTLHAKRSDYQAGIITRNDLLTLSRAAAIADGVDVNAFAGVCVSCLGQVDLCGWVGGMAALCDTLSLNSSDLGQEMGHGYGLDHSRRYGSTADYQDLWDTMSTRNAYMGDDPDFSIRGPGLNAWNMRGRGWLDESRVWNAQATIWNETVQLRPLHRRDLTGFLAAEVGPYLVEFRVPQRWDSGIPRACILVHSFQDNHSYLIPTFGGNADLVEGDSVVFGNPHDPKPGYCFVEVIRIDEENLTATLKVQHIPQSATSTRSILGEVLGGAPVDGDGLILIGNSILRIPPRGPVRELIEEVARYLQIQTSTNNVGSALGMRRSAWEAIVASAARLYADAEEISEHPPGHQRRE